MKFIAHRGYSRRFPENTIPAFAAVVCHPANGRNLIGIELDIHLTSDERIVVMHDTRLPDENGVPAPVCSLALDRLQRLHRALRGPQTPPVPCIREVFDCVNHRTGLYFEIKAADYDPHVFLRKLEAELRRYGPRGDVFFSSFSRDMLARAIPVMQGHGVRYGLLFKNWEELGAAGGGGLAAMDFLHPHYRLVLENPGRLAQAGLPLNCWTVDEPADVKALMQEAPPGLLRAIMTNDIELATRFPEADSV